MYTFIKIGKLVGNIQGCAFADLISFIDEHISVCEESCVAPVFKLSMLVKSHKNGLLQLGDITGTVHILQG